MSTIKNQRARFKVGDWVAFLYGTRNLFAQIIEARGPLGINRRHLYGIRVAGETDEPDCFEVPEDALTAVTSPDKAAIIKYLKEGGLVAMLRSNLGERGVQPKVWLTYARRGEVTHTFLPERGVVGGAAVPYFALHEDKVFTGKEGMVIDYLTRFGLDPTEAQEIVAAVGTAP